MSIGELEKKIGEAASFHRLAASAVRAHPQAAFEYIRAARDILAQMWVDMEGAGKFPQAIVDRVMEIEHGLVEVITDLLR
jgi:hypothetical protein